MKEAFQSLPLGRSKKAKGDDDDSEEEVAILAQESMLKQLYVASAAFCTLAAARVADTLPDIFNEERRYEELITLFSAVDPFLVGLFAFSTGRALADMEEKVKKHEESAAEMRKEAFDRLTEFFE